ncbi:MAG: phosphoribosylformylglycinamidine cyclo-ligase [Actinobacteria bacterium]|nr:phosphoribosylformylglycinamidine cyclo-ligase [Actinomycetota bacterium]
MPGKNKASVNIKKYSYKKSGVDLDKASKAIDLIKESVSSTFSNNVLNDLSSFSGLFKLDLAKYKNPILASSTDGVGTKMLIAKEVNNYRYIGQDLVAMCINDILCSGAIPLFFLDYIACGKLQPVKIKIIVESIAASCRECRTALIGGETAEMPDMYGKDDIDLAGFVVGLVDKSDIIKRDLVNKNDIIVGVSSSGIHSNGFSLVRKIIDDEKLDLGKKYKWTENKVLSDLLLTPTKLYFKIIYEILLKSKIRIHGIAHITGGGFYENIKRVLPFNLDAVVNEGSWQIPRIFKVLQEMGNISRIEMFRVFNMGIGMILIISPDDFYDISSIASEMGEDIYKIGSIVSGSGNVIIAKG